MNFLLSISSFVFPLVTFPYVSRVLTAEGVGAVSFAVSFASYFTLVASLGIPTYGIRACAEARKNKDDLYTVVQELLIISTITTILTAVVYVCIIQLVPRLAEDKILFYICGINIILNTIGANWFFQAIEQFDYITVRSLVFKAASLFLLFLLIHNATDYLLYATITVIAAAGSCLLNFVKMIRMGIFKKRKKYSFSRHIKPTLILFAQSATASIYTNLDTVMLGLIRGNSDVGYYYVATQIKQIFLMVITSFANVLLPRMTSFVTEKKNESFFSTMSTGLNFSLFISLPIAFLTAVIGGDLITLLAGEGYQEAILPTKILLSALVAIGLTQIIGIQVLTPLKQERKVLLSVIAGAIVNVLLNLIMIPVLGAVGAAIATFIAEIVVLIVQLVFARELVKKILKKSGIFRYLLSAIVSWIISSLIYVFWPIEWYIVRLIMTTIIYVLTYIVLLYILKDPFVWTIKNDLRKIIGLKNPIRKK